ncbi:hypothetical protein [Rhodococcus opacus]|uniref:hypothetical protein n=1 Tax=Rhodococcus opacus TaxID=37919 RepID=UPI00155A6B3D|nr:hypothetical protein [Rhodococcus opacus]
MRTVELAQGHLSDIFAFTVPLAFEKTFVSLVAHFTDNDTLGGTAPTVFIRAGLDDPTPVDEGPLSVDIHGSGGAPVARANLRRSTTDGDTFFVSITHTKSAGPWKLQIRNNESEPLRFNGFIANDEHATKRPWPEFSALGRLVFDANAVHSRQILVRNVGVSALSFKDKAGDRFGPAGSKIVISKVPDPIPSHHTGIIEMTSEPLAEVATRQTSTFDHLFTIDDALQLDRRVTYLVDPPLLPRTRCRENDGCREYVRNFDLFPPDFTPDFSCVTCGHFPEDHGLPPAPPFDPFPPFPP